MEKLSRVVTLPPVGKGAGEPQATLLDGHQLPQVGSDEASSTAAFKSVMQSNLPAIYQTMRIFTHQKYWKTMSFICGCSLSTGSLTLHCELIALCNSILHSETLLNTIMRGNGRIACSLQYVIFSLSSFGLCFANNWLTDQ